MIIEKDPIVLQNLDVTNFIKKNKLSELQANYLQTMLTGPSLEQLVQHYYNLGWLVNFNELFSLTQALVEQHFIQNQSFKDYFEKIKPEDEKDFVSKISEFFSGKEQNPADNTIDPKKIPFIRSLKPELQTILLANSKVFEVVKNTRLIKAGNKDRDLFVLLDGQAAIYKVFQNSNRQLIGVLPSGSIFGELGFLLGHSRSADIVTQTNSRILLIKFTPQLENLLNQEKAEMLQIRFWVIHALLNSEIFKYLPVEYFDPLIFSGQIHKMKANQVLFKEGDRGVSLFIIIQGSMAISQKGQRINSLGQGACLGEVAIFVTGGVRTATAHTQSECIVMEIPQQVIYRLLGQNILLAKELEKLAHERLIKDSQRISRLST